MKVGHKPYKCVGFSVLTAGAYVTDGAGASPEGKEKGKRLKAKGKRKNACRLPPAACRLEITNNISPDKSTEHDFIRRNLT